MDCFYSAFGDYNCTNIVEKFTTCDVDYLELTDVATGLTDCCPMNTNKLDEGKCIYCINQSKLVNDVKTNKSGCCQNNEMLEGNYCYSCPQNSKIFIDEENGGKKCCPYDTQKLINGKCLICPFRYTNDGETCKLEDNYSTNNFYAYRFQPLRRHATKKEKKKKKCNDDKKYYKKYCYDACPTGDGMDYRSIKNMCYLCNQEYQEWNGTNIVCKYKNVIPSVSLGNATDAKSVDTVLYTAIINPANKSTITKGSIATGSIGDLVKNISSQSTINTPEPTISTYDLSQSYINTPAPTIPTYDLSQSYINTPAPTISASIY
jgi:hypothetical protein